MRKRGEMVERSFAHVLERGGMRRTWLRGRENIHERYLVHVAGYNLGVLMRALFGAGTPKELRLSGPAFLFVIQTAEAITVVIVAVFDADVAALIIAVASDVACRALLFPGEEDFGMIPPVEVMASRTPVIAYGRGGVTKIRHRGRVGVVFRGANSRRD